MDEIREKQAESMITALASDYWSVYYVNLDRNEGICFRVHTMLENGLKEGEKFAYLERFTDYADRYVTDAYRDGFLAFIQPSAIRGGLEKQELISYRYLVKRNGKESYEMLRMAGVRRAEDRDDGIVHSVGVGFTDVDSEMKNSMKQAEALKVALASAREASRAKTAFLANMSHEMRTPMNAIVGCSKIALADPSISADTREQLEQIESSADQLMLLINNILDMSRIETGTMIMENEPLALAEMLNAIEITFAGRCQTKGLVWKSSLPPGIAGCYIGDGAKLEQALTNLLDNAVKFTPQGGMVNFTVEEKAHYDGKTTLSFTVSDTGIGIGKDFLPKVFDIFSQENAALANQNGSTGLGLALTKSIVEMMNGTLSVRSEKGEGSTFVMTVTLADAKEKEEAQSLHGKDDEAVRLAGRRILVAEDIPVNAKIVAKILSMNRMEVEIACNGKAAVDSFAGHGEGYYDAILMDLRMPVMDGLEATRKIRAMESDFGGHIPIIALTANALDEDVQNSLQTGMDAHLSKPADPEALCSILQRMIGRAEG